MPTMAKEENDNESESPWLDWFGENLEFIAGAVVLTASLVVPVAMWIAMKFFGWEPPEFVQEWIDYFAA